MNIYYRDPHPHGSPNVLLLHGLGATGESWGLQIPLLMGAGFRVIAPDARGFGKSPYPGGGMSIAAMADDMAALLTELKASPAHVVGISMGGTIALQLALDHAPLVSKLVLVNTFARMRPKKMGVWLYFISRLLIVHSFGLPTQARLVARRIFPAPGQEIVREMLIEQIKQANPRGYRAAMRALARFDATPRLSEIKAETLVATGEYDNTVLPPSQRALVEGIPNARQVIIPEAGHAVTVDQPEAFNRILLDFLGVHHLG